MATLEELQQQVAELQATVDALTTPPSDYYTHRWSGEEIDNAVDRSRAGGAIDAALSNKVSVEGGTISDTLNNAVLPGRWTVAVPSDAPGNPFQSQYSTLYGILDVFSQSSGQWLLQIFSSVGSEIGEENAYFRKNINNAGWTDWYRFATATPPQEYSLPLSANVSPTTVIGGTKNSYYKNQFGEVTISLGVDGTITNGMTLFTLPEGYRPSGNVAFACYATDGTGVAIPAFILVGTNGYGGAYNSSGGNMSLIFAIGSFLAS